MLHSSLARRVRVATAAVATATQLACLGPVRPRGSVSYIQETTPSRVWVTLEDGAMHELTGPQVVLDSLVTGWTKRGTEFVAFPLTQVRQISSREHSPGRTALFLGTVATGAVVLGLMLGFGGGSGAGDGGGPDHDGGEP